MNSEGFEMGATMDEMARTGHFDRRRGPSNELVDGPARAVLVIRWCGEDGQAHLYHVLHVMDPSWQYLIPACAEDLSYPVRHARVEVGRTDLIEPHRYDLCDSCGVWRRNHPHAISVAGRVA